MRTELTQEDKNAINEVVKKHTDTTEEAYMMTIAAEWAIQYERAASRARIANLEKQHMIDKDTFLKRVAFKNVSGNWQFKGDMTPERAFKILTDLQNQ